MYREKKSVQIAIGEATMLIKDNAVDAGITEPNSAIGGPINIELDSYRQPAALNQK